jgi:hypothetical protein
MGDITKNFSRYEAECSCCSLCEIDFGIVHRLQTIRDTACWVAQRDTPIVITSGCRCKIHNRKAGGKPSSRHLRGSDRESYRTPFDVSDALDWTFLNEKDKWLLEVFDVIFRNTWTGGWHLYLDRGFIHCDLRGEKGRWE